MVNYREGAGSRSVGEGFSTEVSSGHGPWYKGSRMRWHQPFDLAVGKQSCSVAPGK